MSDESDLGASARLVLLDTCSFIFSGGFKPTTPIVRAKPTRTSKPPSRTEAGPSSKPSKGRKNIPQPTIDNSDIEEMTAPSGPFDFSTVGADNDEPARKTQSRRADATPVANGKANGKGKGKAKVPQTKSATRKLGDDPMDVDPIDVPDENEEPEPKQQVTAKP
ncbi:hypothetical protein C0992_001743, partial [Termitomyces sp. T32_za158]